MVSCFVCGSSGRIVSCSMHEPTTHTRAIAGAMRIASPRVPGTPIASKSTSGRRPSSRCQTSIGDSDGRVDRMGRTHGDRNRIAGAASSR